MAYPDSIPPQLSAPTDADRIALTNMFRAIADFGRKARLRREQALQAEATGSREETDKPLSDEESQE